MVQARIKCWLGFLNLWIDQSPKSSSTWSVLHYHVILFQAWEPRKITWEPSGNDPEAMVLIQYSANTHSLSIYPKYVQQPDGKDEEEEGERQYSGQDDDEDDDDDDDDGVCDGASIQVAAVAPAV